MGMDSYGGRQDMKSDINVTPLVDVCLVLLIIFMVVTPMLQKGKPVMLPQTERPDKKPESDKVAHRERMLNYPAPNDAAMQARLHQRKAESGLGHRDDLKTFVDYIDADEKRF